MSEPITFDRVESLRKPTRMDGGRRILFSYIDQLRAGLTDRDAKIAAALALADRWTAIHGHDQRAATHHALADDLREVLGGGS